MVHRGAATCQVLAENESPEAYDSQVDLSPDIGRTSHDHWVTPNRSRPSFVVVRSPA